MVILVSKVLKIINLLGYQYFKRSHSTAPAIYVKKGKVIPLQARCGPEGG